MNLQSHGPYFALKRGNGSIVHPDSAEVYIFAKGIGPYTRHSAERDGLTAVPVMIQEIPESDLICQRAREASLERARKESRPVWWKEILGVVLVGFGMAVAIYHGSAGWAAFTGVYLGLWMKDLHSKLESTVHTSGERS